MALEGHAVDRRLGARGGAREQPLVLQREREVQRLLAHVGERGGGAGALLAREEGDRLVRVRVRVLGLGC